MTANVKPFAIGLFAAVAAIPFAMQAPAQAAPCPVSMNSAFAPTTAGDFATYATVFAPSFSCTLGDKIFSNFTLPSFATLNTANLRFWWDYDPINDPMNSFMRYGVISSAAAFPTSTAGVTTSFKFQVDIDPLIAPINYISAASLSTPNTLPSSKTLTITPAGTLPAYPTSVSYNVSATLTGPTSNVRAYGIGITQDMVPGPLPILGAGLAFGYSRKLRNRVRRLA
jgi:hypothetical protein